MKATLPDWYRGFADRIIHVRNAYCSEDAFLERAGITGYLSALFLANLISRPERERMEAAANNALSFSIQSLTHPIHKKEA